jgi:hypothetical protein
MKKTLLAALATVLLIGGALGAPTTAAADEYPGTVATTTDAGGPHKMTVGKKPKSSVFIKSAGSGKPVGTIRVQYLHKASETSRFKTVGYQGERVTFFGPALKKVGKWQLRFTFRPQADSVWKTSRDSYSLNVVKKKR